MTSGVSELTATGTARFPAPWPTAGCLLGRKRYRLLAEIGRDDRFAVRLWQGRDLVLDRDVALTLFTAAALDAASVSSIHSAVTRALRSARLEVAGAARVLDVLEPERPDAASGIVVAVVVAEWTPGWALVDLLEDGPLPPLMAAHVLVPLADAVDTAHNAGLILGCDHPDRIRVTADRQARFAFPGPPPASGSRDDIRGLGAMLYLLLTGCWPLRDGPAGLPLAPLGPDGTPISPLRLQPEVPVELSTLALRCIADSDKGGGVRTGAAVRQVLEHNSSNDEFTAGGRARDSRQAERQRRIKFRVAMTALGAATLMIIGYAGAQVVSVFTDTGAAPLVIAGATPTRSAPSAPVLAAPTRVKSLAVYDPSGLGSPDHQRDVGKLLDGNPNTGWSTDSYIAQFPVYKKGLGVMLSFEAPISAASVTVVSPSVGTVIEIRTAMSPNAPLEQTTLVGTATLKSGSNQIPLRAGSPTRYLLIWITGLGGKEGRHQSKLSDLQIQQRAT